MRSPLLALALALALCAGTALAQKAPPKLEPLPEPPPPPNVREGSAEEPRVRIGEPQEVVEEIRDNGRIVMLKVTPPGGAPYYLIDTTGNGNWVRRDPTDPGIRAPMWVIRSFD